MRYFYAANQLGVPLLQLHAEPPDVPALAEHAEGHETPYAGNGRQDGTDAA